MSTDGCLFRSNTNKPAKRTNKEQRSFHIRVALLHYQISHLEFPAGPCGRQYDIYIYLKILNALPKHKGKFRDLANALANFRLASDVYRGLNHSASGDILIRSFYRVG